MEDPSNPISATQIDTYLGCPRKWAWRYVMGKRPPPAASAELGTEMHAQLAAYLADGKPLDFTVRSGEIAAAGLHLIPAPKTPGLEVEKEFRFVSPSGATYLGFIDYRLLEAEIPLVGDHKSTKDFKWAKTPEDLLYDPQAVLYAVDTMRVTGKDTVDLHWTYYKTQGAKGAKQVHLRMHADHVAEVFSEIEDVVRTLEKTRAYVATTGQILDIEYHADHCGAFGGCPFQGDCNLSPMERMGSIMSQGTTGTSALLARMKARAEGKTEAPTEAAPPAPAAINPPEFQPPPPPPADVAPTAEPVKRARKTAAAGAAAAKIPEGFTLYVNCLPVGENIARAEEMFRIANDTVCAAFGKEKGQVIHDYREIPFHGAGLFAAEVGRLVDGTPRDLTIDTSTAESQACLSTLSARAARVVVGSK